MPDPVTWFCSCGTEVTERRMCDPCVERQRQEDAAREHPCPACDYGLPMNCTCPA